MVACRRVCGVWDSRGDKIPALVIAMLPLVWLRGFRVYLGVVFVGSMLWEVLHLPLYTIWTTGTLREQAFAAGHCTVGDLVIAAGALTLALLLVGAPRWPRVPFSPPAAPPVASGLTSPAFS